MTIGNINANLSRYIMLFTILTSIVVKLIAYTNSFRMRTEALSDISKVGNKLIHSMLWTSRVFKR
jgi:hypothetical protein